VRACVRVCVCARSNKLASFIYQCHHPFTSTLSSRLHTRPDFGERGCFPGFGKFARATPSVTHQTDLVRVVWESCVSAHVSSVPSTVARPAMSAVSSQSGENGNIVELIEKRLIVRVTEETIH